MLLGEDQPSRGLARLQCRGLSVQAVKLSGIQQRTERTKNHDKTRQILLYKVQVPEGCSPAYCFDTVNTMWQSFSAGGWEMSEYQNRHHWSKTTSSPGPGNLHPHDKIFPYVPIQNLKTGVCQTCMHEGAGEFQVTWSLRSWENNCLLTFMGVTCFGFKAVISLWPLMKRSKLIMQPAPIILLK